MKEYIYSLHDPSNDEIKYIGKTNDLQSRLYSHLTQIGNTKKDEWIISLLENGVEPIIKEVECVDSDKIKEREKFWIKYYLDNGASLLNRHYVQSNTTKKTISDIKPTALRIPSALLDKIKERAEKENRSIPNMIITALKEIFR